MYVYIYIYIYGPCRAMLLFELTFHWGVYGTFFSTNKNLIAFATAFRYPVAHQARGAGLYHRADLLPVRGERGDFFNSPTKVWSN